MGLSLLRASRLPLLMYILHDAQYVHAWTCQGARLALQPIGCLQLQTLQGITAAMLDRRVCDSGRAFSSRSELYISITVFMRK